MQSNDLAYFTEDPHNYSENKIVDDLKSRHKDQYLQTWDRKARETQTIQNHYKFSDHLNVIDNIQDRIMITKLRTR